MWFSDVSALRLGCSAIRIATWCKLWADSVPSVWNDYANEVSRLPLLTMLMEMSRPPESIKVFLRHLILGDLVDALSGSCACVSRVSWFVQCSNRCIAPQGHCDVAFLTCATGSHQGFSAAHAVSFWYGVAFRPWHSFIMIVLFGACLKMFYQFRNFYRKY